MSNVLWMFYMGLYKHILWDEGTKLLFSAKNIAMGGSE